MEKEWNVNPPLFKRFFFFFSSCFLSFYQSKSSNLALSEQFAVEGPVKDESILPKCSWKQLSGRQEEKADVCAVTVLMCP